MSRALDGMLTLSSDRKSIYVYADLNTHNRSCGENRSDWTLVAKIPLSELPGHLNTLVSGKDGTRIYL